MYYTTQASYTCDVRLCNDNIIYDFLSTRAYSELVTCDEFIFSPNGELVTLNSSQRLSQGNVNSPHSDLVTLATSWPSHSELVADVTTTVTTVLSADTELTILRTLFLLRVCTN